MLRKSVIFVLLLLSSSCCEAIADTAAARSSSSPSLSDADKCISLIQHEVFSKQKLLGRRRTLAGLVGIGCDDLLNVETAPVFDARFENCQFTPDGVYLVPDGVTVLPIHRSNLDSIARYYANFTEFDRRVMKERSVSGGFSFFGLFSISGSYSTRHQEVKRSIDQLRTAMLHTTLTAHVYTLLAAETSPLADAFRARIDELAVAVKAGLTKKANLLAELIIRDFGTHVVSRAEVGALLEKEDFIEDSFDMRSSEVLDAMRSSAGASFGDMLNVSVSFARETAKSELERFTKSVKDSRVRTIGGPSVNRLISSAAQNEQLLVDDVVAFNVKGIALANLMIPHNFPAYPYDLLRSVRANIERASDAYYKHNTVRGCTSVTAPNFNFQANVDDGSCLPITNRYEFGGVFQLCRPNKAWCSVFCDFFESLCDDIKQPNLFTGAMTCADGYNAVKVFSITHSFPDRHNKIHWQICDENFYASLCEYGHNDYLFKDVLDVDFFECRGPVSGASAAPAEGRGAMFGGIYADDQSKLNEFTGRSGCPDHFIPYRMGVGRFVCVSRDYELATRASVPFAHFFSCQSSDKACPQGYSQHLAGVFEDCEVYACVRTGVFRRFESRPIDRPPYTDALHIFTNVSVSTINVYFQDVHYMEISLEDALRRADELLMVGTLKTGDSLANSADQIDYKLEVFMNHTKSQMLKLARENSAVWKTIKNSAQNGSTSANLAALMNPNFGEGEGGSGGGNIVTRFFYWASVLGVLLLLGVFFLYLFSLYRKQSKLFEEYQQIY